MGIQFTNLRWMEGWVNLEPATWTHWDWTQVVSRVLGAVLQYKHCVLQLTFILVVNIWVVNVKVCRLCVCVRACMHVHTLQMLEKLSVWILYCYAQKRFGHVPLLACLSNCEHWVPGMPTDNSWHWIVSNFLSRTYFPLSFCEVIKFAEKWHFHLCIDKNYRIFPSIQLFSISFQL